MLRPFSFIFCFLIGFNSFGINDYSNLKETIHFFGNAVKDGKKLPEEFKITHPQYKKLAILERSSKSEKEINRQFDIYTRSNTYDYEKLMRIVGKVKSIISYDTITYTSNGTNLINVSIVYFLTKQEQKKTNRKTLRILTRFAIIDNKLTFSKKGTVSDDYGFEQDEMDLVQNTRRQEFNDLYRSFLFNTSTDHFVPYRKKNKWGLQSLIDDSKSSLTYDSIYAFKKGYARVALQGKYNLLDSLGKEVFNEWLEEILFVRREYKVLTPFGKYVLFTGDSSIIIEKTEKEEDLVGPPSRATVDVPGYKRNIPKKRPIPASIALRDSLSKCYGSYDTYVNRKISNRYGEDTYIIIRRKTQDTLHTFNAFLSYSFGDYVFKLKDNTTTVIDETGQELFRTNSITKPHSPGYLDIYDRETRLLGIYCPYTGLYIAPRYKYIKAIDRDRFFIVMTLNGELGYLDSEGNELFD